MNVMLFIIALVVIILPSFFVQRKQQRYARELNNLQDNLVIGDRVVTTARIHGVIRGIHESTVELEIAQHTVVVIDKAAIVQKKNDHDDVEIVDSTVHNDSRDE
ncbi:preprotein translocase subunit YajC [Corynebacterium sp. sy017]|uniref:preprotein translocase subunit YajC n=1 Tax=unclassified Corynebacterium TaxID=2624378 RepID=UPI0011854BFE|nr:MULTISPECIES: preprotein translocase subunit YajC [unclassified Corynebacterium]MBP3087720.1 preprotein translocase subunit YajC [Corynebacterium sp. sy017]TSD92274.1 preprotein translocase subunit YajC [Corynebacterium sp. SY003]